MAANIDQDSANINRGELFTKQGLYQHTSYMDQASHSTGELDDC